MKKLLFVLLNCCVHFYLFSQISDVTLSKFLKSDLCYRFDEINEIRFDDEYYYLISWESKKSIELKKSNLHLDENLFVYFNDKDDLYKEYLIIEGANYCFTFNYNNPRIANSSRKILQDKPFAFMEIRDYEAETVSKKSSNFLINGFSCSSFYSEYLQSKKISYVPDYLNCIIDNRTFESNWIKRNPWVPGKDRNASGIGEYLEIEFSTPKNNLVVLNGYVDLEKRYLYKANNRVKKATITSLDKDNPFTVEYEFEDYVHFSEINFPCAVNKVRFTIDEVYKGEKWDDTCIQAVITRWE